MRIDNLHLPVGKIVTAFVENGLTVSEAVTLEESLEDYFKRVTGGEGIAFARRHRGDCSHAVFYGAG